MKQVFLSLGSNKGNRFLQIQESVKKIQYSAGTLIQISDIFESKSWAYEDADYLNTVLEIETTLSPDKLLKEIQNIEKKLGRMSKTQIINNKAVYSSREIDIDILFYENEIINSEKLIIPHPLLHLRKFVLQPMMQIAPNFIHPVFDKKIETLYIRCEDKNSLTLFKKTQSKDFHLL